MLKTNFLNAAAGTSGNQMIMVIIIYAALFAAFYFFLIRPKSKKQKEDQQMRESLDVGDDITTIGGIVGKIVSMRDEEDAIIVETGADKARIKLKKWAVSTIDSEKDNEKDTKTETESKGFFGRKKNKDKEETK